MGCFQMNNGADPSVPNRSLLNLKPLYPLFVNAVYPLYSFHVSCMLLSPINAMTHDVLPTLVLINENNQFDVCVLCDWLSVDGLYPFRLSGTSENIQHASYNICERKISE